MDRYNTASLKNSFYKACKVFLILLLQVIVYKLKVFVFKDFEFDVVVDIRYRYKVNSLPPLFLAFINLLADVCYTVYIVRSG